MRWNDCNSSYQTPLSVLLKWLRRSYGEWRTPPGNPRTNYLKKSKLCAKFKNILRARGLADRSIENIQSKISSLEHTMKTAWLLLEAKSLEHDVALDLCDEALKKDVLWCCPQFKALATVMAGDAMLMRPSKRSADVESEPPELAPNRKRQRFIKGDPSLEKEQDTAHSPTTSISGDEDPVCNMIQFSKKFLVNEDDSYGNQSDGQGNDDADTNEHNEHERTEKQDHDLEGAKEGKRTGNTKQNIVDLCGYESNGSGVQSFKNEGEAPHSIKSEVLCVKTESGEQLMHLRD